MFTDKYKYLGLIFSEYLDYEVMAKAVAVSANRALGLLIAKFKACVGMPFDVYTKLYDALVMLIVDYGTAIWGCREFTCINSIRNKAFRFFLGVGRYTPNRSAVQGDIGWKLMYHKIWLNVFNFWLKVKEISDDRITKKVHVWSLNEYARGNRKNWFHNLNVICGKIE